MNFFPSSTHILTTRLAPENVYHILNTSTTPKSFPLLSNDTRIKFIGTVTQDSFSITHCPSYRNSFTPRIDGTITPDQAGSVLNLQMKLPPIVRIFMAVWFSGVSIFFLFSLLLLFVNVGDSVVALLITGCMLIFGFLL